MTHGAHGYTTGHCRCPVCRRGHADAARSYRRSREARIASLKAELAELRSWRDQTMASAPGGTQ